MERQPATSSPEGLRYEDTGSARYSASHETLRQGEAQSFQPWHFFVLLSLLAATVAVLVSRQNAPEHLVLISLTIGAAGASAFACYRMVAPLSSRDDDRIAQPLSDSLRADLEREKALTLRSIKELEFDRAMGKLSQGDFEEMARRLRARAMGIMKQLDEGADYRAVIERELAARAAKAAPQATVKARAQRVSATAASDAAVATCACGTRNDADARFCKSCGARLEGA